ncbi:MAG: hypothetical protein JKY48_08395 [Flavobacteriales bacterium]|nr:hypothetical protein [Flavobacteriales bacterium]
MRITAILLISILILSCENNQATTEKEEIKREVTQVLENYPDGKTKVEGERVNGERHGIWKYYYESGFLWSEGKYWYGKRKGYSIVYHKNGKKKLEGSYKNDLKIGEWKLWDKDGSLYKTINMDELLTTNDSLKLELK